MLELRPVECFQVRETWQSRLPRRSSKPDPPPAKKRGDRLCSFTTRAPKRVYMHRGIVGSNKTQIQEATPRSARQKLCSGSGGFECPTHTQTGPVQAAPNLYHSRTMHRRIPCMLQWLYARGRPSSRKLAPKSPNSKTLKHPGCWGQNLKTLNGVKALNPPPQTQEPHNLCKQPTKPQKPNNPQNKPNIPKPESL